jgi:hypothetical protein
MGSENAHGCSQKAKNTSSFALASALTFLDRYNIDGNEFLNHTVRGTGDETWGFIWEC